MTDVVVSTQEVARARAAQIRAGIQNYLHTLANVAAAYQGRDWKALGYDSWESYVDGEYGAERLRLSPEHRQKAVAELRLAGMSMRAIGSAVGVDEKTARNDLRGAEFSAPDEIQGADGKTYAAARPNSSAGPIAPSDSATDTGQPGDTTAVEQPEGSTDGADDDSEPVGPASAGAPVANAAPARPGPVEGSPGPGRVTPHDPDEFAAALDRLVPDPNPHRDWQRRFLDALSGLHNLMRFKPEDVAGRADDQCIDEFVRVAEQFGDYRAALIRAVTSKPLPSNVHPIRRAQ